MTAQEAYEKRISTRTGRSKKFNLGVTQNSRNMARIPELDMRAKDPSATRGRKTLRGHSMYMNNRKYNTGELKLGIT